MQEQEVTPGTEEFNKMVFKLSESMNDDIKQALSYNGNQLEEIQDGIYVMPVYVTDDFNIFFVVSQLIEDDWIVAFTEATIENETEITDLSDPIPTGEGLNLLGEHSPNDANQLLKYFETLVEAKRGEWRLIQ
ncbi:hypothetical protein AKUA2103_08540 [Apilactobacillus kunkeei]|uniref:hypothetical protein n=1 Tax=Apilactobacillus kunkeei TaxID=148814 RepID=UPI00110CE471|nr:hypothetical protein [Apilactobacillus kunkeei]TMS99360.1 hypothetical protein FD690_06415 [Apilactobacillus kunkeei]CAI2608639.1 hypothetical protein AKUH4B204J_08550 [Apilactobacillus kunkeei]CAI2609662.1 hypothetical protein AKUH4B402J_08540 [Apilactobacillus kunkeei]CAI2611990.1 hypothetical protein AKUH1B302M_08780 [Apilactobacillus kunkeei]CAI2680011.1 hypothetical protein AKUA2103_08540 [Apilactobacillus kunkeei]